jgi:hypothetical protein
MRVVRQSARKWSFACLGHSVHPSGGGSPSSPKGLKKSSAVSVSAKKVIDAGGSSIRSSECDDKTDLPRLEASLTEYEADNHRKGGEVRWERLNFAGLRVEEGSYRCPGLHTNILMTFESGVPIIDSPSRYCREKEFDFKLGKSIPALMRDITTIFEC